MWPQRVLRRPTRRLITKNSAFQASFFTNSVKPGGNSPAFLIASAAAAGSVGTLAYFEITSAKTSNSAQGKKLGPGAAPIPDLNTQGPSDRIEYSPAINAKEVDDLLNKGAFSCRDDSVRRLEKYDGAQVGSNAICEDAYIHGKFANPLKTGDRTDWLAWGVFDGHNGWQTSNLLTKQLLPYVQRSLQNIEPKDGVISDAQIHEAIGTAFRNLDDALVKSAKDIIDSDLPYPEKVKRLEPAEAGACALLTLYDPSSGKLHVASTGDCRAVMGYSVADGKWEALPLTKDHTGSNKEEIARLQAQFPDEPNVCKRGRVYGMQPSRSFGDGVYKWDKELRERLRAEYNAFRQPAATHYPGFNKGPYLTASPVVSTVQLPKDGSPSFLIQATDGLWDTMGNQNAVDLVSRWSELQKGSKQDRDKKSSSPPSEPVKFGRSGCWYADHRATYRDPNAAVHLIRNGLGGSHDEMIRGALSFEPPLSRWVRDDVTVQVVFFNGESK